MCELLFKSYYVVWKLRDRPVFQYADKVFKSYYVVWKRWPIQGEKRSEIRFKSYYVVWKRPGDIDVVRTV